MKIKSLLVALLISATLISCGSSSERNNVSIQTEAVPGFNVQNFAEVVKKTTDPASIEKAINAPGNSVNNMTLANHKDNSVDFLKVVESDKTIQVIDNDVDPNVTVATLNVSPQANNQAAMNIQGNQQYCGNDYSYHSNFSLTDAILLSYLLRPHVYYHPYYRPYYHPPYYHSYTRTTYRTVTTPSARQSMNTSTSATSAPTRSSLSSPTRSQRSFSTTPSNSGASRSSGFGSRSSSSGRSSFGSSSSRSFGGGRRR